MINVTHHMPDEAHDASVQALAAIFVAGVKNLPHFQAINVGATDADVETSAINSCVAGLILHFHQESNLMGPPVAHGIGCAIGSWLFQTNGLEVGVPILVDAIKEGAQGAALMGQTPGSC